MNYEQSLATVRGLSSGALKRDPDAIIPPKPEPIIVPPTERHKRGDGLVDVIGEELQRMYEFTAPQLAWRAHFRRPQSDISVVKATVYTFLNRAIIARNVIIAHKAIKSVSVAIFRNMRYAEDLNP